MPEAASARRRVTVAWVFATLAIALVLASFLGMGAGPFGWFWMAHMATAYLAIVAILILVLYLADSGMTPSSGGHRNRPPGA